MKKKSLEFYAYLCRKIGSKNLVKARRVLYTIGDIAMDNNFPRISSGSKGEGLNFKSSDTDVMFLEPNLMVYEYGSDLTDNHKEALIMDTRDTPPCFTYLRISTSLYSDTEQMLQQKDGESLLSNELFKMHRLNNLASTHILRNLHGPCISDDSEQYDIAYCIKYHVMSKLTDKTIPSLVDTSHDPIIITQIQKYQMELMKQEKITTIVKHSINLDICIDRKALAVLPELKQDTTDPFTVFPSIPMAYFIRFLCYYRLDDHQSFMNAFMELLQKNIMTQFQYNIYRDLSSVNVLDLIYIPYFLGISLQMIGENDLAKQCFEITATMDYFHFTPSEGEENGTNPQTGTADISHEPDEADDDRLDQVMLAEVERTLKDTFNEQIKQNETNQEPELEDVNIISNGRFPVINTEEKENIVDDANSKSTKKQTKYGVNIFRQWLLEREKNVDFEDLDITSLDATLTEFYAEVRSTDGNMHLRAIIHN
ncbi:unnamed protein product [Mytilus edulis]|uniref:Uncharacterized protein n=1 Tax=Mytilus edulis TaxID=6550 RepID=A0A8S3SM36_MYTED|nr:unnamed protein product [Mytilus edulis]